MELTHWTGYDESGMFCKSTAAKKSNSTAEHGSMHCHDNKIKLEHDFEKP